MARKSTPSSLLKDDFSRSIVGFLAALIVGALIPRTLVFLVRRVLLHSLKEVFVLAMAGWLTDRLTLLRPARNRPADRLDDSFNTNTPSQTSYLNMEISDIQSALEDLAMTFLPKVAGVIVLLLGAWIVARWLSGRVTKALSHKLDITIARFFGSLIKYGVIIMAVLGCLRIFGFETTSFAALIGAAGLAIGLALQGTLSNFSSGVMLLIFRPFTVGDVVSAGGVTGKVVDLSLFTTEFDTPDNRRIIVPNGQIYGSTIENITFHDTRRVDVSVGTSYPASIPQTRDVLLAAVQGIEGLHAEPAPVAYLVDLGDSSINWSVRVWSNTPDYWAVRERVTQSIKSALDEAGIGIPFPQMDVHLNGELIRK